MLVTAQDNDNDIWIQFWNTDTILIGFKDKHGAVKIKPKFVGFTMAKKFEHIIAVMEDDKESYKSYYVTKTGRKVGRDSLFIYEHI